jgi:hypothetical protein
VEVDRALFDLSDELTERSGAGINSSSTWRIVCIEEAEAIDVRRTAFTDVFGGLSGSRGVS